MDVILETPSVPVAISDDDIGKGETTLTMQCHDRTFHNITVLGEAGEKISPWRAKALDHGAGAEQSKTPLALTSSTYAKPWSIS
jgi:hypothetical protein